jgi:hypothetical protein
MRMKKLGEGRLLGRFFASTRAKLREIGERLVSGTWSTWRVARLRDTNLNRGSHQTVAARLPCRSMKVQRLLTHI